MVATAMGARTTVISQYFASDLTLFRRGTSDLSHPEDMTDAQGGYEYLDLYQK
jgi:hypothetical protein